jgi:hypothetical protein
MTGNSSGPAVREQLERLATAIVPEFTTRPPPSALRSQPGAIR